jgi:hypothetical protein
MRKVLILLAGVAVLLLSGCATAPPDPTMRTEVDHQKVYLVEQWARRNNVTVIWMSTPTRSVPVASGS